MERDILDHFEFTGGPDQGQIEPHGRVEPKMFGGEVFFARREEASQLPGTQTMGRRVKRSGTFDLDKDEAVTVPHYQIDLTALPAPALFGQVMAPKGVVACDVSFGRQTAPMGGGTAQCAAAPGSFGSGGHGRPFAALRPRPS